MSSLPKSSNIPPTTDAQAMYEGLMAQLDSIEEITRESLITSQQTIARFERQHRMTSADMREKLKAGEIEETYDICCWLQEIEILRVILSDLA